MLLISQTSAFGLQMLQLCIGFLLALMEASRAISGRGTLRAATEREPREEKSVSFERQRRYDTAVHVR